MRGGDKSLYRKKLEKEWCFNFKRGVKDEDLGKRGAGGGVNKFNILVQNGHFSIICRQPH